MNEEQTAQPAIDAEDNDLMESDLSEEAPDEQQFAGVDLARVRELVLAAHPDVVPEMIQGETFDDLIASVEPAREAYQRIIAEQRQASTTPRVAAQPGQRSATVVDIDALSPLAKISEGLRRV